MADNEKSLVRRIVAIFDRASAKKAEDELAASMGAAGAKGGENFVRETKAVFDKRMAELKVQLAKGLIDPKQFRIQGDLAAKQFNAGIIAGMDKARAANKLTDAEFLKLSRTLKRVGDDGVSAWSRIRGSIVNAGAALALWFGARRLLSFAKESVLAAIEESKAFNMLAGALANVGIAYADVEKEIKATTRALEESANITDDEVAVALTKLITITGDYQASLRNVGLVADVAAFKHIGVEEAAVLVGKAMTGNTRVLKEFGIVTKDTVAGLEILRSKLSGTANDSITPVEKLSKSWGELKEAIGRALLTTSNGESVIVSIVGIIRNLTHWLDDNSDSFARWGRVGVAAITGIATALFLIPRSLANIAVILKEGFLNWRVTPEMREAWDNLKSDIHTTEEAALESGKAIRIALGLEKDTVVHTQRATRAVRDFTAATDDQTRAIKGKNEAIEETPPPADPDKAAEAVQFPERFRTPEEEFKLGGEEMQQDNADRAAEFVTPWTEGLKALRSQVDAERGLFAELGEAWAQGGIIGVAQWAKWKAKENLASVIEETAKGIGALFVNPAAAATHFKSAAVHGAAAAAWKALAGATGGGGSGGGGGGSGVPDSGGDRGRRGDSVAAKGPEVTIVLTGPGFDALNPEVQRVVWGAQEAARERFGENAKVTVRRDR